MVHDLYKLLSGLRPERRERLIRKLPKIEQAAVYHTLYQGMSQDEAAAKMGVSQPTISYSTKRALDRIRFFLEFRPLTLREIAKVQRLSSEDQQIIMLFQKTTVQSTVARELGVSQGLVRWRLFKFVARLESHPDLLARFNMAMTNLTVASSVHGRKNSFRLPSKFGTLKAPSHSDDIDVDAVVAYLRFNGPERLIAVRKKLGLSERTLQRIYQEGDRLHLHGHHLHIVAPPERQRDESVWNVEIRRFVRAYERTKFGWLMLWLGYGKSDWQHSSQMKKVEKTLRRHGWVEVGDEFWEIPGRGDSVSSL